MWLFIYGCFQANVVLCPPVLVVKMSLLLSICFSGCSLARQLISIWLQIKTEKKLFKAKLKIILANNILRFKFTFCLKLRRYLFCNLFFFFFFFTTVPIILILFQTVDSIVLTPCNLFFCYIEWRWTCCWKFRKKVLCSLSFTSLLCQISHQI